eukprot:9484681-Pyramimonas_sp.AAC.1
MAALMAQFGRTLTDMSEVAAYAAPRTHPKLTPAVPTPEWFTEHFIAKDHVKIFSSDVLRVCPVLLEFLRDRCSGRLSGGRIRCFELL